MNLRSIKSLFFLIFSGFAVLNAQKPKFRYLSIAYTQSASSFPVSGFPQLWKARIHPGITVGSGFNWKEGKQLKWTQTVKAGYFYHRFIQHAVLCYTETGIRYMPGKLGISAMVGAGYLHSIPATGRFRLLNNGTYQSFGRGGRAQGMFGFTLGFDYPASKNFRVFTRLQTLLQTPFVPGYVPLLPVNQVHVGFTVPFSKFKKS